MTKGVAVLMFISPGPLELLIIAVMLGVPALGIALLFVVMLRRQDAGRYDGSQDQDSFWSDWSDEDGQQHDS